MNRRGAEAGEMTLVIIFGFILFIIVGGIALSLNIFYGTPLDYRNSDSSLLYTSVIRCLQGNILSDAFFASFLQQCNLAGDTLNNQHFVVYIASDKQTYFSIGDHVQCQLQNKNDAYARCSSSDIVTKINGHEELLHIMIGSNQQSRLGGTA